MLLSTAVSEMTSVSFSPCGSLVQAASTQNDVTIFDVRCSPYKALARLRHKFATDGFTEATNLQDEDTQGDARLVSSLWSIVSFSHLPFALFAQVCIGQCGRRMAKFWPQEAKTGAFGSGT